MNQVLRWLAGGDLRSDGMSNEAAGFILGHMQFFEDLYAGLHEDNETIRGRAADALEKVARQRPDVFVGRLDDLVRIARHDPVPMVRWHLAMILGHLAADGWRADDLKRTLLSMLADSSAFVRSWAISSLCILGRNHPRMRSQILKRLAPLQRDASIAVRSRVRNAMTLLLDQDAPFPKGWIKARCMHDVKGTHKG